MSGWNELLKNKNFFLLWLGQIVSQFGDRLNQMALIALVYKRTGGSAFELAKIMSLTVVPSFLISPFAGAYVDRWNRKFTMVATDVIRAGLVLLIPLAMRNSSPLVLYVLIFLVFSASCFFVPSKFSIIPDIVPREKLLMANSLTNVTMMIAAVLGVGIGGTLIEMVGPRTGFMLDSLTFLFSALLISSLTVKVSVISPAENVSSPLPPRSVFFDIREGIHYVLSHPYLRLIFLTIFILMSAAGGVYIVGIVFIQRIFGSATRDLGILSVFLGGGFFLGALLYGRFGARVSKVRVIFISMISGGVLLGLFAVALKVYADLRLAAGLSLLTGLSLVPVFISGNTLVHEVIKAKMRGRIFSSLGIVMNLGFLISMFVASKVSEMIEPMWVILIIGVLFMGFGIYGLSNFKARR